MSRSWQVGMQSRVFTEFQSWLNDVNTRPAANLTAPCRSACFNQLSNDIPARDLDLSRA